MPQPDTALHIGGGRADASTERMCHHRRQRSSASRCRAWHCVQSRQSGWRSRQASRRRRHADAPAAASHRSRMTRPCWCGAFSGHPALNVDPWKALQATLQCALMPWPGLTGPPMPCQTHVMAHVARTMLQVAGRLLPEVVAHDDFVGRTGIHGGWHPQVRFGSASSCREGGVLHAAHSI